MNKLKIVKVTPNDIPELQRIGWTTFSETFSDFNTEENMHTYLNNSFSIAKLTEQVKRDGSQFYFAVLDENIIGYVKLNTGCEQTELKDARALEIERIYVLKAFHGQSVGQVLYEKALEIATQAGVKYVWLGVWEKNDRAIRFYAKNGFVPFDRHIFKLGSDMQTDIMMKKAI